MPNSSIYPVESPLMRLLTRLGAENMAWSLRRLHCPVGRDALVLEVGSGGNPYPRANVLLDAYEETRERWWVPLVIDRPLVLGYTEHLPFRSGAFDFVIASHVLEHSSNPPRFLAELQRVAQAGYIEVPDAFMERINPYPDHRLEITVRQNRLVIRNKPNSIVDDELVELYEARVKPFMTREFMQQRPFSFHVRHYWYGNIAYEIVNPGVDAHWTAPAETSWPQSSSVGMKARGQVVNALRHALSQRSRNKTIDLFSLLRCPTCYSEKDLDQLPDHLICKACDTSYPVRNRIPKMYPQTVSGKDSAFYMNVGG
jgi:uncharacterized protein YbaR (Trm112 family)